MTYLRFVCAKDPIDSGSDDHDTDILIRRCDHCGQFAVAGYQCVCGVDDTDPSHAMMGHGKGQCAD